MWMRSPRCSGRPLQPRHNACAGEAPTISDLASAWDLAAGGLQADCDGVKSKQGSKISYVEDVILLSRGEGSDI